MFVLEMNITDSLQYILRQDRDSVKFNGSCWYCYCLNKLQDGVRRQARGEILKYVNRTVRFSV